MRSALSVRAHDNAWQHGACGEVTFKDCRVPAGNLLGDDAAALLTGADARGRGIPLFQALNLGIGRAAYEAALDYAHLRVQGGRPLIEHQAIATKLAEIAIRLEVARARSGRRPGRPIIPRPSPTAACPICRCRPWRRCSPPR